MKVRKEIVCGEGCDLDAAHGSTGGSFLGLSSVLFFFFNLGRDCMVFTFLLICSKAHLCFISCSFCVLFHNKKHLVKNVISEVPLTCFYQGLFLQCCVWLLGNTLSTFSMTFQRDGHRV